MHLTPSSISINGDGILTKRNFASTIAPSALLITLLIPWVFTIFGHFSSTMAIQLAAAITSFVISFLIVPVILKYSLRKHLVDVPGRRKIHKKVTPSMGGIAIFIGFFISFIIWNE